MIRTFYFFYILMSSIQIGHTTSIKSLPEWQSSEEQSIFFTNMNKNANRVNQSMLPIPYNYLLTQPLMTKGIEDYYQRTPIIHTIYARKNESDNSYYRLITMLVDHDKARNNADFAQKKEEAFVVELAFIKMNFNALPQKVIKEVLHTNTPFGKLLMNNHIKTLSQDRTYFSLQCNELLSSLTHCKLKSTLYGRTNTLVRTDNNQWVAQVVEILPGLINMELH